MKRNESMRGLRKGVVHVHEDITTAPSASTIIVSQKLYTKSYLFGTIIKYKDMIIHIPYTDTCVKTFIDLHDNDNHIIIERIRRERITHHWFEDSL